MIFTLLLEYAVGSINANSELGLTSKYFANSVTSISMSNVIAIKVTLFRIN
jgi:hypothetical protein